MNTIIQKSIITTQASTRNCFVYDTIETNVFHKPNIKQKHVLVKNRIQYSNIFQSQNHWQNISPNYNSHSCQRSFLSIYRVNNAIL
jgi:hypothetical protein